MYPLLFLHHRLKNNLLAADKCARYLIHGNSLTIKNVAEEDAGDYTVVLRLKQWNLIKNLTMTLKVNGKLFTCFLILSTCAHVL